MRGTRLGRAVWRGAHVALVAVAVVGCSAVGGGNTPNANPNQNPGVRVATLVTVAPVTQGPISQVVSYTGTVQASDTVNVVPNISGRITKLNVDVGSQVKAGDVIAELDKTTLQAQVGQAQAAVEVAQVKLQQIQAGARPETVAAAQANVAGAQAKLNALQAEGRPQTVAQAQANLAAAQAKLAAIQAGPRPEAVAEAKASLDAAQAKLKQLTDGATPDQVATAQLQVEQSKDSLLAAQTSRDATCRFAGPQCNAANATVMAAETAVNLANQNLKTLTDPPTQDAINQAQAAVDQAQQAYLLAQKPYTAQDVAQAQAAVNAAAQAVSLAQNPNTANDIAQQQAVVNAAADQAQLAANPYTDLDVKSAQAGVDQARAALQAAQTNLSQATITAPFDGVVSAKLLSLGALATPSTPIVTIISPSLQVQFSVEEARISAIKVGQTVNLTSQAFPGKLFPAKVTSIFPSADPKTHTFTVNVQVDRSTDLKPGMFVGLQVILNQDNQATLVPLAAVVQQGQQSVVYVDDNGTAHVQPVTTGITDDQHVQITQGVSVGQQVITSGQTNLTEGTPVRIAGQPTSGGTSGAGGQRAGQSGAARPTSQGTVTSSRTSRATPTPASG